MATSEQKVVSFEGHFFVFVFVETVQFGHFPVGCLYGFAQIDQQGRIEYFFTEIAFVELFVQCVLVKYLELREGEFLGQERKTEPGGV